LLPNGLASPPSAPSEHAERKRKEKEGKTPLHLTQKTRKTRKISQNEEKSKEKLGGYREKEYIRCGYQAVGYQYDAKQ
jgi:hypothetical protein